jgi:hypothetical protein
MLQCRSVARTLVFASRKAGAEAITSAIECLQHDYPAPGL